MKKVEKIFARVCKKYNIERPFTKEDFYRICEGERILLLDREEFREQAKDIETLGFLRLYKDRFFIYLACFYGKKFDRLVAFHELGHYFCRHLPFASYKGTEERLESEADHFCFLATGLKRRGKSK